MQLKSKFLAGMLLSAAMIFSRSAQALEIPKFDKLSNDDQSSYVQLLLEGTAKILKGEGKTADMEKMWHYFNDIPSGAEASEGTIDFLRNLVMARRLDEKNAADSNFHGPRLHVEHVLLLTLKKQGIEVPKDQLMEIGKDFKPTATSSSATQPTTQPTTRP